MMLSGKPTSFIILFSPSVLVRKEGERAVEWVFDPLLRLAFHSVIFCFLRGK